MKLNQGSQSLSLVVIIIALFAQLERSMGSPLGDRIGNNPNSLDRRSMGRARLPLSVESTENNNIPALHREPRGRGKITETWLDKIDVSSYLRNTRAVNLQIDCLLKDAVCDSVGKEIKRLIPLAMQYDNPCRICSKSQIRKVRQIIAHIQKNYPQEWSEGVHKFGNPKMAF